MDTDKTERAAQACERLEYLDGLLIAINRRTEILELVADSASADEALPALAALLSVPNM